MIIIDKEKTASFDVDPQRSFTPLCPNELPVPEGDQIVSELNRMASFAKYRIGSKDIHAPGSLHQSTPEAPQFTPVGLPNIDIKWTAHAVSGTLGAEFLPGLPHWSEYNYLAYKGLEMDCHVYSAIFHDLSKTISTGVIEWLKVYGIDTVLVGGLCTEYCCSSTAIDLANAGFKVIFNRSAMRALNPMLNIDNLKLEDTKNIEEFKKLYEVGIIVIDSCRGMM